MEAIMGRSFPKSGYNPVTGEWNDSLKGEFLWSNVNVSEAVPDVMTPSTWSLWWIYHYEASPFEFPGDFPFCGNICGRPYLNLSLITSLYRAIGKDVRKELQGDMVGSAPAR
jgi:rifampicin phosphotransferase